ncbi:MAG: NAD(P)-dependent oxidoreductase [Anaerolineales bacterium]|nr:NAD(P)-dependent oxidoreductase [Anaerolineales bacterium]
MSARYIGLLHPGTMGISIAATAQRGGHHLQWASAGRSSATRARAQQFDLVDAGTVAGLCARCDLILSVCPPHAAEAVANEVAAHAFRGLYVDANAIAPQRAVRIGAALAQAGAEFVDGGIIGGPAWEPGRTWLYLSGPRAAEVAACFAAGPLETRVLAGEAGQASALKMCYAAYSKGTTALLAGILAAAEQYGARTALEQEWDQDDPGFSARAAQRARRSTAKAWRFAGEMDEIAATFRAAGLPGEFHAAAAEVYRRLAVFKDAAEAPSLEVVLAALRARP